MENKFLGCLMQNGKTIANVELDKNGQKVISFIENSINLTECLSFSSTGCGSEWMDIKEYILSRIDNYLEIKETEEKQKTEKNWQNFFDNVAESIKVLDERTAQISKDMEEIKQDKKKQDEMITGENLQQLLNKRPELSSFVQCTNGILYITKESVNNVATTLKDVKRSLV